MEDKEIIKGNCIISLFMGSIRNPLGDIGHDLENTYYDGIGRHGGYARNFDYHSSWDGIMTVVDNIELIEDERYGRFAVHIYSNACSIESTQTDFRHKLPLYISDPNAILNTKIESTWYNVVSFIKWYSQHKQTTP